MVVLLFFLFFFLTTNYKPFALLFGIPKMGRGAPPEKERNENCKSLILNGLHRSTSLRSLKKLEFNRLTPIKSIG